MKTLGALPLLHPANMPAARFPRLPLRPLLVICCLVHLSTVQAQTLEYTVQPADNPWDFARQHLKHGMVDALIELNKITDPHHLVPGSIFRIPDQWLFRGSRPVKVIDVYGNAEALTAGGKRRTLRPGDSIPASSTIRTTEQSSVTLQFADGSRLLVRELSDVRLKKNSFVPLAEGRDIRLTVPNGKIENDISKQGQRPGRFEIQTPSGVAAVRGTRFRVASAAKETRTEVVEGKVAVADRRGQNVALPAGFGMAMQNGRNGASKPLLDAPRISQDSLLVEHLPIELPLQAIPGAVAYRTLVSAPGLLTASLSDQETKAPVIRIRDIPDGDYLLRVRAIDVDGLEGSETERPVSINARPNAPFLMGPLADASLSAPRPAFKWAALPGASSYHFQLADNAAFNPLTINAPGLTEPAFQPDSDLPEGKYFWHVATVSANEGQGPYSTGETFLRTPALPGLLVHTEEQQVLRWQAQANARYRIQLGSERNLESPQIDRVLEENQISLSELDAGTYFARIQTLGKSGLNSPWSDIQTFTIESAFDWRYLLLPIPLLLLL